MVKRKGSPWASVRSSFTATPVTAELHLDAGPDSQIALIADLDRDQDLLRQRAAFGAGRRNLNAEHGQIGRDAEGTRLRSVGVVQAVAAASSPARGPAPARPRSRWSRDRRAGSRCGARRPRCRSASPQTSNAVRQSFVRHVAVVRSAFGSLNVHCRVSLLLTNTISALPSLSTSATTGFSSRVRLERRLARRARCRWHRRRCGSSTRRCRRPRPRRRR